MTERSYFELSADKDCPSCKGEGVVEHARYDYGSLGQRVGGPPPLTTFAVKLCTCVRSRVLNARPGGRSTTEVQHPVPVTIDQTFKTWRIYFEAMLDCKKPFDVRKADPEREPVRVGDTIRFVETDHYSGDTTGRTLTCKITYVLNGDGVVLPLGWFVMGWNPVCTGARVEP